MENEEEIWKVYPEYPWIEVSNLGIVRTKDRYVRGKINKTHGWWFTYADSNVIEKTKKKFGDEIACKVEKLMRKI